MLTRIFATQKETHINVLTLKRAMRRMYLCICPMFVPAVVLFVVCLLVAYRPSNMRVYLRDGSAQTILRAATLR